jgi:hypothetical protein
VTVGRLYYIVDMLDASGDAASAITTRVRNVLITNGTVFFKVISNFKIASKRWCHMQDGSRPPS